jgi:hypothetical protein
VHPVVTESYLDGTLLDIVRPPRQDETADELSESQRLYPEEACVLRLIKTYTVLAQKAA